jgi:hypothetical protein
MQFVAGHFSGFMKRKSSLPLIRAGDEEKRPTESKVTERIFLRRLLPAFLCGLKDL